MGTLVQTWSDDATATSHWVQVLPEYLTLLGGVVCGPPRFPVRLRMNVYGSHVRSDDRLHAFGLDDVRITCSYVDACLFQLGSPKLVATFTVRARGRT